MTKILLTLSMSVLAGCGSAAVDRRPMPVSLVGAGSGAELVFAPSDLGSEAPGMWATDRFAAKPAARAFDEWSWPAASRPSLARARRLSLPTTASTQVYFRESRTEWERATTLDGGLWLVP